MLMSVTRRRVLTSAAAAVVVGVAIVAVSDARHSKALRRAVEAGDVSDLKASRGTEGWEDRDGRTLLFFAPNGAIASMLIERGLSVQSTDRFGVTPLHHAAARGADDVVDLLLAAGAPVGATTRYGDTPLHWAVTEGAALNPPLMDVDPAAGAREKVAARLIAAGASPNARNTFGDTPLFGAVALGDRRCVKVLVRAGADVNLKSDGWTALHQAALYKVEPEIVRYLLAAGADPTQRDRDGKSPRDVAQEQQARPLIELLSK
jgi:ankyrin repeat protein